MTLLDILAKWAGLAGPELIEFLRRAAAAAPDLAPKIEEWIAALTQGLSSANITAIAGSILSEASDVSQGHFKGEQHPNDLA